MNNCDGCQAGMGIIPYPELHGRLHVDSKGNVHMVCTRVLYEIQGDAHKQIDWVDEEKDHE